MQMVPRWGGWTSVRSWLDAVATLAFIVTCAVVTWATLTPRMRPVTGAAAEPRAVPPAPVPLPTKAISLNGATLQGDPKAKVALIVYSDFQCPFCARFGKDSLPGIQARYVKTGRVLVAFRQFPLNIHAFARKAAEASLCAGKQGRFWEMHDQLFLHQQS